MTAAAGNYAGDPDYITIEGNRIDSSQHPPAANVILLYCPPHSHVNVSGNTVTGTYGTALNLYGGLSGAP